MIQQSDALKHLLKLMRDHPAFDELLAQVNSPSLPRFTTAKIPDSDKTFVEWVFKSAKREQHNMWLSLLTGKPQKETND